MPDGIVIVISLLVLAIIVAVVLPLSQKAAADPFVDVGAVTPERTAYIERGVSLYNKFSDTNDVTKGNYLQSWDPAALAEGDQDLKAASMTSDLVPDGTAPTGVVVIDVDVAAAATVVVIVDVAAAAAAASVVVIVDVDVAAAVS